MISAPAEKEGTVTGMAEYIERDALIEWLKRIPLIDLSDGRGLCRVIMEDDFKKAIKKMPKGIIDDVEPVKRGRWKRYGKNLGECSECGEIVSVRSNYCPNCGAKMMEG